MLRVVMVVVDGCARGSVNDSGSVGGSTGGFSGGVVVDVGADGVGDISNGGGIGCSDDGVGDLSSVGVLVVVLTVVMLESSYIVLALVAECCK